MAGHGMGMPEGAWAEPLHVYAFPLWKHRFVARCFPGREVVFLREGAAVPERGTLVLWGMAPLPPGTPAGMPVLRLEDGFLRSVGLGAELVRPVSWVVDPLGMYYDATRPSELERLLQQGEFGPELLARARALRRQVLAAGLTKYNVGARAWQRPAQARRVVLVVGQVESDASLAWGAPRVRGNLELLRGVREACPDAYLLYKPHPDVVAGLRKLGAGEQTAGGLCDELVGDVAMGELLGALGERDEVHVMTSLAGFEALLRGVPVVCHGQPFYAGWGLTRDMLPHPRRTRRLGLDELVAAALLLYPLYLGEDGALVGAEQAVAELAAWKRRRGGATRWWQAPWRMLLRRFIGVR